MNHYISLGHSEAQLAIQAIQAELTRRDKAAVSGLPEQEDMEVAQIGVAAIIGGQV